MKPRSQVAAAADATTTTQARVKELVIYVEDNQDNWEVAKLRLSRAYDVVRASTDEEACRLVREHHGRIAAILMDIELQGSTLDGIELVKLFTGKTSGKDARLPAYAKDVPIVDAPIIFVTAYGQRYSETQLLAVGAQRVVNKPVSFSELMLALTSLHLKRVSDVAKTA